MKWRIPRSFVLGLVLVCGTDPCSTWAQETDLAPHLAALRGVGPEGASNEAAAAAWKVVAAAPAGSLPTLLMALDGANPLAQNWLRAAAGAIADRTLAAREPMPLEAGMLITLEPGIYLPGWGGMRLEGNWVITEDGARRLDRYPDRL